MSGFDAVLLIGQAREARAWAEAVATAAVLGPLGFYITSLPRTVAFEDDGLS